MTSRPKHNGFWRTVLLAGMGAFLSAACGCIAPQNGPSPNYAEVSVDVSPDGKHLLFIGQGKRAADIFVLDLTTGNVERLTDTDTDKLRPKFSADGKRIVFSQGKPGFRPDGYLFDRRLFVMELATKKVTQITFAPANQPASRTRYDFEPAFSADGRFVVFNGSWPRNGSPFSYVCDAFCVEVASGNVRRLTHDAQNARMCPVFGENDASVIYPVHKNEKEWEGGYLMSLPFHTAPLKTAPTPTLLTPKGANYYDPRPMGKGRLLLISDPGRKWIWKLTIREANGTFTYLDSSINGMSNPTYDKAHHRIFYLEGMGNLTCYDLKTKTKKIIAGQAFFAAPLTRKIDQLP